MNKTATASVAVNSLSQRDTWISIFIIGLLFFIFGFVSWVNAILIPYFKIACELTNFNPTSLRLPFIYLILLFLCRLPTY